MFLFRNTAIESLFIIHSLREKSYQEFTNGKEIFSTKLRNIEGKIRQK